MRFEDLPEPVLNSIKTGFAETVIQKKRNCPRCNNDTVERHIDKEEAQDWNNKWYVEYCTSVKCTYWSCGFTSEE